MSLKGGTQEMSKQQRKVSLRRGEVVSQKRCDRKGSDLTSPGVRAGIPGRGNKELWHGGGRRHTELPWVLGNKPEQKAV